MILEVSWTALGHFLLGSHNFVVTALGSCVKWPLDIEFDPMSVDDISDAFC